MKINARQFYTCLFVIVLFLQLYMPSFKGNVFLQLALLSVYFVAAKISLSMGFLKQMLPLFYLLLLGFAGTMLYHFQTIDIIKDLSHFIKPITGLLIGYFFYKEIGDFRVFAKTIVIAGFLSALVHFGIVVFFGGLATGSVEGVREFARDNFLELFSIFFLGYYKKFAGDTIFKSKAKHYFVFGILLISNIFYFSRTMIVAAIILALTLHGYTLLTRKSLKIIGAVVLIIILFYTYLFSIKLDRNKDGLEGFLFKLRLAPAEMFKSRIDKENHKDLWDHWRGYEATRAIALMNEHPASYLYGNGHGSLVNLKFKAPLNNEGGLKYISELHNGYVFILYKTGIIGLLIYLAMLWKLYRTVYRKRDFASLLLSATGLIFFFTTLTITGAYNARDIIIFLVGALIYFSNNAKATEAESL